MTAFFISPRKQPPSPVRTSPRKYEPCLTSQSSPITVGPLSPTPGSITVPSPMKMLPPSRKIDEPKTLAPLQT